MNKEELATIKSEFKAQASRRKRRQIVVLILANSTLDFLSKY